MRAFVPAASRAVAPGRLASPGLRPPSGCVSLNDGGRRRALHEFDAIALGSEPTVTTMAQREVSAMAERILSNDEIAEMEKLTVDRLVETIDRGDREGAKKLARRMYNEFLSMHDLYRNWTAAPLSFVGRRFGDKALEEAMDEGVKAWWGPSLDKMPQDVRARVKMFAAGLRGHLQPLHIEEDDEKVVIQMQPCGSGGRLVLEGKDQGPDALLTVKGKQFLTYGRDSFPVYCAHEPAMERQDIEAHGAPFVVVEPAHELGKEHCNFIIYKDRSKVPAKYYERLGLKKPDPAP